MPSMLVPLALSAGGLLAGKLFSGKRPTLPEVPDLITPAVRRVNTEFDIAERRREQGAESAFDRLQAQLAAAGVSGSGGTSQLQALFRNNLLSEADLQSRRAANVADTRTRAKNQQQRMEYERGLNQYQQDLQRYYNRAQGISDIFGSLGSAYTYQSLANPDQGFMEMLGLGNLFSGSPDNLPQFLPLTGVGGTV